MVYNMRIYKTYSTYKNFLRVQLMINTHSPSKLPEDKLNFLFIIQKKKIQNYIAQKKNLHCGWRTITIAHTSNNMECFHTCLRYHTISPQNIHYYIRQIYECWGSFTIFSSLQRGYFTLSMEEVGIIILSYHLLSYMVFRQSIKIFSTQMS